MRIKQSYEKITMAHTQTICPNCTAHRTSKKATHPAEVGALASVFEKSATELKKKKKKKKNC